MPDRRIGAAEELRVEHQRLAEVVHPPRDPCLPDQPVLDDPLDPDPRRGIAEIDQRRVERGVADEIRRPVLPLDQVARLPRRDEERVVPGLEAQERVDIAEHPPAPGLHVGDQRAPVRIVALVQPPVPPELLAHLGGPHPGPVLDPEPGQRHPRLAQRRELPPHHRAAALHPGDHAAMHPVRQRPHPPGIARVALDQLQRRPPIENPADHPPRPDLDLEPLRLPQVEGRILLVLQEHRPQPAGDEMRRRAFGDIRAAAGAARQQIHQPGDEPPAAADAVLLHQDRQELALLVEEGELLAEAEEALLRAAREPQRHPVGAAPRPVERHGEAQLVRRHRLERQRIAQPAPRPGEPAAQGYARCLRRHCLHRGMAPARRDPVADREGALRNAADMVDRARPLGDQELPVRIGLPEHPPRLGGMRDRDDPARDRDPEVPRRERPLRRCRAGRDPRHRGRGSAGRQEFAPLHPPTRLRVRTAASPSAPARGRRSSPGWRPRRPMSSPSISMRVTRSPRPRLGKAQRQNESNA